jgi:hypothetical protein
MDKISAMPGSEKTLERMNRSYKVPDKKGLKD